MFYRKLRKMRIVEPELETLWSNDHLVWSIGLAFGFIIFVYCFKMAITRPFCWAVIIKLFGLAYDCTIVFFKFNLLVCFTTFLSWFDDKQKTIIVPILSDILMSQSEPATLPTINLCVALRVNNKMSLELIDINTYFHKRTHINLNVH